MTASPGRVGCTNGDQKLVLGWDKGIAIARVWLRKRAGNLLDWPTSRSGVFSHCWDSSDINSFNHEPVYCVIFASKNAPSWTMRI